MPSLSQIIIYPIKSLPGIAVERWPLDKRGLFLDRHWMLVDHNQHFLSQRQMPQMALISVDLLEDQLVLRASGHEELILSLASPQNTETLEVTVWNDRCQALAISREVDRWFSSVLGAPCQLVCHAPYDVREVDPTYALPSDQTAFSDGFPLLVVSQASLIQLEHQVGEKLSMARFRPNLVVDDCDAYAEDYWRRIQIGEIGFRLPKPCSRCSVPAIDPQTAEVGKEPLTTLNRLRRWNGKVYFGQNALHNQTGWLQVGDKVTIVERGPAQPPLD